MGSRPQPLVTGALIRTYARNFGTMLLMRASQKMFSALPLRAFLKPMSMY